MEIDIAAASIQMSNMEAAQEIDVSIAKMAMDTVDTRAADFMKLLDANLKVMEQSVNPHIGGNLDIKI